MKKEIVSTSFDTILDALGHVDRRRLFLALLHANVDDELPVEVDTLEHDSTEDAFRLSMRHVHLPKLDDDGFVDTNSDHTAVTTGPRFDEIRPLLELLDANRGQLPDDWLPQPRRQ